MSKKIKSKLKAHGMRISRGQVLGKKKSLWQKLKEWVYDFIRS